jgi:hypothetical protein
MNAKQIQIVGGEPLDAWRCGTCGMIYRSDIEIAERCCKCTDCGCEIDPKKTGARSTLCDKCWRPHYAKLDANRLDRAEDIVGYDGPVIVGDQYYPSVQEYSDYCGDDELPEFVHTCDIEHYVLDADDILTNLHENAGLEDQQDLDGVKEFEAAVAAFNDANKDTVYWTEDSKHKVRVPKPTNEEVA